MKPKFIVILTCFFGLYIALSAYIGWNGWIYLSTLTGWQHPGLYNTCIAVLAFGFIIGRIAQSSSIRPIAEWLKLIGAYWFAILEYGILILPIANLISLLLRWAGLEKVVYITGIGSVVSLLIVALLLRGSWNAWNPIIRTYHVQLAKQARAGGRDKLRIAMASDIHLGTIIGNRHLERLVDCVSRIKPDIILLPGDILDDDIKPFLRRNMSATLSKLSAPLGVYAVTGNHEYIGRKVQEFIDALDAAGIRLLMDEALLVQDSFYVVGRKDKASESFTEQSRKSIKELLEPLDLSLPIIMMDHQPSDLASAANNGVDLLLSGHTHRGQMAPNHLITRRLFELDWGYRHKDTLHAIVSSGFGFWGPPIRIGSRSEVLHIEVNFTK